MKVSLFTLIGQWFKGKEAITMANMTKGNDDPFAVPVAPGVPSVDAPNPWDPDYVKDRMREMYRWLCDRANQSRRADYEQRLALAVEREAQIAEGQPLPLRPPVPRKFMVVEQIVASTGGLNLELVESLEPIEFTAPPEPKRPYGEGVFGPQGERPQWVDPQTREEVWRAHPGETAAAGLVWTDAQGRQWYCYRTPWGAQWRRAAGAGA